MDHVLRRALVAIVSVAALVGLAAAFASAAAGDANRPAITFVSPSPDEGTTLTTDSVTFAFTYNRTPKQTATLSCDLAGPTPSTGACDAATAIPGGGSRS